VKDTKTGEPIIKGHTITGFTSEAEVTMKVDAELKTWNRPLVEEHAAELGATCKQSLARGPEVSD
jgi:D-lactate dehydratase